MNAVTGPPATEATFSIGEVAAMLGISPHTIRAWERRHRAVRPGRTQSGQRRYSADDVELLRQVKYERHVHGLSMRVATLVAQGLIVPEEMDDRAPRPEPADVVAAAADPLRLVADLVPEVVLVLDEAGRISHTNTALVRFLDVLPRQLRGLAFADVVDPFDRAKAVEVYRPPLRQRRGWELSLSMGRRRGFFSFDCWPVERGDGSWLVLVGSGLDAGRAAPGSFADLEPDGQAPGHRPARMGGGELRALLERAADPRRSLLLLRRWLEATALGVALVTADAQLTIGYANRAFEQSVGPERRPVQGTPARSAWVGAGGRQLVAGVENVIRTGRTLRLPLCEPAAPGATGPAAAGAVWDVELGPVADLRGATTHVVIVASDVTLEVDAWQRLRALVESAPLLRDTSEPETLVRGAARYAQELLPGADALLAAVPVGRREDVSVVAASGLWSEASQGRNQEVRMGLVREAVRARASAELEWNPGQGGGEVVRIVPLLPGRPLPDGGEVLGAIAFVRRGSGPFRADERQLIDEFAGRLAGALERAEQRRPAVVTSSLAAVSPWRRRTGAAREVREPSARAATTGLGARSV
ncbi:MAG TPA: MerR family transcriptional regulator [Candidatus Dormibacteraeota bacterium]